MGAMKSLNTARALSGDGPQERQVRMRQQWGRKRRPVAARPLEPALSCPGCGNTKGLAESQREPGRFLCRGCCCDFDAPAVTTLGCPACGEPVSEANGNGIWVVNPHVLGMRALVHTGRSTWSTGCCVTRYSASLGIGSERV